MIRFMLGCLCGAGVAYMYLSGMITLPQVQLSSSGSKSKSGHTNRISKHHEAIV